MSPRVRSLRVTLCPLLAAARQRRCFRRLSKAAAAALEPQALAPKGLIFLGVARRKMRTLIK